MNEEKKYQKHLTLQDRYDIEEGLNHGWNFVFHLRLLKINVILAQTT